MAQQTVYCEECLEEIPADEVYWEESRLYCRRCGSELEPPDSDIFEDIVEHRAGMRFRDDEPPDHDDEEDEARAKGLNVVDDADEAASEAEEATPEDKDEDEKPE